MRKLDFDISFIAWLASFATLYGSPPIVAGIALGATTLNLLHQRAVLYNAGAEFTSRIRAAIVGDYDALVARIVAYERRLDANEAGVRDVKAAQGNINTALRGPRFGVGGQGPA